MKDSKNNKKSLMILSYNLLTKNFTKTVNRFIVFKDGIDIIEIPHGTGNRSKFIDLLIKHFEEEEEYEKCDKLVQLKTLVIEVGD